LRNKKTSLKKQKDLLQGGADTYLRFRLLTISVGDEKTALKFVNLPPEGPQNYSALNTLNFVGNVQTYYT